MAVFNFSALSDGQAISFDPDADLLNFDQSSIAAADVSVKVSGADAVVTHLDSGKRVTLLDVSPLELATSNVSFANGSQLLFGDNSTALGDNAANSLFGTGGNDLLSGFGGADQLHAGSGADTVLGGTGNDTLRGNGGNDWMEGGEGNDDLGGGGGTDAFAFREMGAANADVLSDYAANWDSIHLDIGAFSALGDNGRFTSGDARFTANASGTAQDSTDRIIFNTSNGQLLYDADGNGSGAAVLFATLPSGRSVVASDIHVFGTPTSDNTFVGTEGDDTIAGSAGADTMVGLDGNDTYIVNHSGDEVVEEQNGGVDTVEASVSHTLDPWVNNLTLVTGFVENDGTPEEFATGNEIDNVIRIEADIGKIVVITGGEGDDTLIGGSGRNQYDYGTFGSGETHGNDSVDGSAGQDVLLFGDATPVFVDLAVGTASGGGTGTAVVSGIEWVVGGSLDDVLRAGDTGVRLSGWAGSDTLVGGAGNDHLEGTGLQGFLGDVALVDPSHDDLAGGGGDDLLVGDAGDDRLSGGAGNDTLIGFGDQGFPDADDFIFDVAPGAANADLIRDFGWGEDEIHLDNVAHANLGPTGRFAPSDPRFISTSLGAARDADDRVVYNWTTGELWYDADGSGAGLQQLIATLEGAPGLDAADIVVFGEGGGGSTIVGTEGDDTLSGTEDRDIIDGRGGDDTITGHAGDDYLAGGDGADTISGGDGDDTLAGYYEGRREIGGPDSLDGGLGNDVYHVSSGDVLSDAGGVDTVVAMDTSWTLAAGFENLRLDQIDSDGSVSGIGNELDNFIVASWSGNLLDGRGGNDTIFGGSGDDTFRLSGDYGHDHLDGGDSRESFDRVDLREASSAIVADLGAGTVTGGGPGGSGSATIVNIGGVLGGDFDDLMIAADAPTVAAHFFGGGGNDTLRGGASHDHLTGGAGDDTITGGAGDDHVQMFYFGYGFFGDYGNDSVDGGEGDDLLNYDGAPSGVEIDLAAGLATGGGPSGAGSVTFTSIESATGSAFADRLTGDAGDNDLRGGDGADRLDGGAGNDDLRGGSFDGDADLYVFSKSAGEANADRVDVLETGLDKLVFDGTVFTALGPSGAFAAGDERFFAAPGASAGHDATDRLVYDSSAQRLYYDADGSGPGAALLVATGAPGLVATDIVVENGAAGSTIVGTEGDDTITGTEGDDVIEGRGGSDDIFGLGGNDTINGGTGHDFTDGGDGDDSFILDGATQAYGSDTIVGDAGSDTIVLHASSRVIFANFQMFGGDTAGSTPSLFSVENLIIASGAFDDSLTGNVGDNHLDAGAGNDALNGRWDNDVLTGGAGADTFTFDVEPGSANADRLTDFASGTDELALDNVVHPHLGVPGDFAAGDPRFHAGDGATSGQDPSDRVIYDTATGNLYHDADGSGPGAAQLIATLEGAPLLSATDIRVVGDPTPATIVGTEGDDTLIGTEGDDDIEGRGGNDTLHGRGGNDTLDGGLGFDHLIGGEGDDVLSDFYNVDGERDTLDGGLGNDTYNLRNNPFADYTPVLVDAGGIDTIFSNHDFVLPEGFEKLELFEGVVGTGNALDNTITTHTNEPHAYFVDGADGNDTLIGGEDPDVFAFAAGSGNYGNDSVDGGDGFDRLSFSGARSAIVADMRAGTLSGGGTSGSGTVAYTNIEAIHAGAFDDRLTAHDGAAFGGPWLTGGGGNDTLTGGASSDDLWGEDGNDVLSGRGGNDILFGGTGSDQIVFDVGPGTSNADRITGFESSIDEIHLDNTAHANLGAAGDFGAGDARFAANATGTAQDATDRVIYNTTSGELWYDADGSGAGARQLIATLEGAPVLAATDFVVIGDGSSGPIMGTEGDDFIAGTDGADTMVGLGGNDTYVVNHAGDEVVEEENGGIDTVQASVSHSLDAWVNNLVLTGSAAIDGTGNEIDNVLTGNSAINNLSGGLGNDTYVVSTGDVLSDSGGIDTVESDVPWNLATGFENLRFTGTGAVTGFGNAAANVITGNGANNRLESGSGADTIVAGAGDDLVRGNNDADWLEGGAGNDDLGGGGGQDAFVFREAGAAHADTVGDFASNWDSVRLDNAALSALGGDGRFSSGDGRFWAAAGATSGHDANDRIVYNTSTGSLYYDADGSGSGAAQLIATFTTTPTIVASDIYVI